MYISRTVCLFLCFLTSLPATIVPRMAFEQIVDESGKIIHGHVLDVRAERSGQIIWTHYRVQVMDSLKGANTGIVTISEPGGTLNGVTMQIDGVMHYQSGDEVVLFLYQTPVGFWRTTGWGQGKFEVTEARGAKQVHAAQNGADIAPNPKTSGGRNMESFNDQSLDAFLSAIRRQVNAR